jgi:hypothetical protein
MFIGLGQNVVMELIQMQKVGEHALIMEVSNIGSIAMAPPKVPGGAIKFICGERNFYLFGYQFFLFSFKVF